MAHLAPPDPPFPAAAGLANFPQSLSFSPIPVSRHPLCVRHPARDRPGRQPAGDRDHSGGPAAMKKRIRRFVLHHENLCAFILSIFGAFLTIVLAG